MLAIGCLAAGVGPPTRPRGSLHREEKKLGFHKRGHLFRRDIVIRRGNRDDYIFKAVLEKSGLEERVKILRRSLGALCLSCAMLCAPSSGPADAKAFDGREVIQSFAGSIESNNMFKKSYMIQAVLNNSGEVSMEEAVKMPTVVEPAGKGEKVESTQSGNEKTDKDPKGIRDQIKWLNQVTSRATEELNEISPPPLRGQVESAISKVSATQLSSVGGVMSSVVTDLKEGFVGLKNTISNFDQIAVNEKKGAEVSVAGTSEKSAETAKEATHAAEQ